MQIYNANFLLTSFFIGFFSFSCFSQIKVNSPEGNSKAVISSSEFDEQGIRAMALKEGIPDYAIGDFIAKEKQIFQEIRNNSLSASTKKYTLAAPFASSCGDMGAENGWTGWKGRKGVSVDDSSTGKHVIITNWTTSWTSPPPASNTSYEFTINTAGNDACTPSAGNPTIPLVSPGFGNASIQLGKTKVPYGASGQCVEQISFDFTVAPKDTNFVYSYAIVLDNPNGGGHVGRAAPYAEIYMLDDLGDTVQCSHQFYHGKDDGTNPPGFFTANCNGLLDHRAYKPWTLVGVNLNKYVGKTLHVFVTNADCAYGAHGCWSYWDFRCSSFGSSSGFFCPGTQVSLTAPTDPQINYTYQWYQNGKPYTGTPNDTAQTITPFPHMGDTFFVELRQPSKCNFKIVYVPQSYPIKADFSSTGTCGKVTFIDASTSVNGAGNITAWHWGFPGGTPSSSNTQDPGPITYASLGTYSVTLAVTSAMGCIDSIVLPVTITGLPQAAFSSIPVCEGDSTHFTNTTIAAAGDPIASFSWALPGGSPTSSASQNPSVLYPAGTYTASLIVTSQAGCTSILSQPITVHAIPVANFNTNIVCFNNPTAFTNLSSGTSSGWSWDFGDGNTSTQQNPSHTYGSFGAFTVILTASDGTCKDTISLPVVVNPLPVVNFSSPAVCFGDSTCFKDLSTISSGSVSGWNWNFGDPSSGSSNISNLQNPCHVYSAATTSTVLLTVISNNGCQGVLTQTVSVFPPPVASIVPQGGCVNSPTYFTDASTSQAGDPVNSWNWLFGDGGISTQQNPSYIYKAPGSYTITLNVITQHGCKDTTTNTVTVSPPPVANFSGSGSGCAPVCVTNFKDISTSVNSTITNWAWSFPGGNPSTAIVKNPQSICYNKGGTYGASLIVTSGNGCKDTLELSPLVNVYALPTADFCVSPNPAPVSDPVFHFCDQWSSDVTHWSWNFGDISPIDSTNTDPIHSYSASATMNDFYTYDICIRVQTQHACWDTICKKIELIPEFTFYIPNTFTPNGDDNNQLFYGKCRGVKEYNIWVFDRWGNQLWDCHYEDKNTNWDDQGQEGLSSHCQWDGKIVRGGLDMSGASGELPQEDVYVWKVKLTDIFDKKHTYIGNVNIVR